MTTDPLDIYYGDIPEFELICDFSSRQIEIILNQFNNEDLAPVICFLSPGNKKLVTSHLPDDRLKALIPICENLEMPAPDRLDELRNLVSYRIRSLVEDGRIKIGSAKEEAGLVAAIEGFTFEQICDYTHDDISTILQNTSNADLATATLYLPEDLSQLVFSLLPDDRLNTVRNLLNTMDQPAEYELTETKSRILETINTLHEKGEISQIEIISQEKLNAMLSDPGTPDDRTTDKDYNILTQDEIDTLLCSTGAPGKEDSFEPPAKGQVLSQDEIEALLFPDRTEATEEGEEEAAE